MNKKKQTNKQKIIIITCSFLTKKKINKYNLIWLTLEKNSYCNVYLGKKIISDFFKLFFFNRSRGKLILLSCNSKVFLRHKRLFLTGFHQSKSKVCLMTQTRIQMARRKYLVQSYTNVHPIPCPSFPSLQSYCSIFINKPPDRKQLKRRFAMNNVKRFENFS